MKRLIRKATEDDSIIENLPLDLKSRIQEIDKLTQEYTRKPHVSNEERDQYHNLLRERANILKDGWNKAVMKFIDEAKEVSIEREDMPTISDVLGILLNLQNGHDDDGKRESLIKAGIGHLKRLIVDELSYILYDNVMLSNIRTKEKLIDLLISRMGINKWQFQKLIEFDEIKNLIDEIIYKEFPHIAPKGSQLNAQDRNDLSRLVYSIQGFIDSEEFNHYYAEFKKAFKMFKSDPTHEKSYLKAGLLESTLEEMIEDWNIIKRSDGYKVAIKHGIINKDDIVGEYLDKARVAVGNPADMRSQQEFYTADEIVQKFVDSWNFIVPGHKNITNYLNDLISHINEYIEQNR